MLIVILMLIAGACAMAAYRWRWGVFAAIVVVLLQDPLRKMVPGVPGYLAMASLPVWMATLASAMFSGEVKVRAFLANFPKFYQRVSVFAFYLLIPAMISATYGHNTWMITLLGAVIYSTGFFALACGWGFPTTRVSVFSILMFYVVATSIVLIGGPIDYFGWIPGLSAIGTEAMGKIWVTYRMGSDGVFMYAGFFRSPDVMGWHAAMVTMIAGVLSVRSKGWLRWLLVGLAVWGMLNIWICGRRKMIAMIPLFVGSLLLLTCKFQGMKRTVLLGGIIAVVGALCSVGIAYTYHETSIDAFYGSAVGDAGDRALQHGIGAVKETVKQAGFLGYGLGMGQQGIHHIPAEKPHIWQEGGAGKIVVELGVPGAVLLLSMGAVLFLSAFYVVAKFSQSQLFMLYAGIFSILVANAGCAVVSAQIFGDPFIMLFLMFLVGLLLSGARVRIVEEMSDV